MNTDKVVKHMNANQVVSAVTDALEKLDKYRVTTKPVFNVHIAEKILKRYGTTAMNIVNHYDVVIDGDDIYVGEMKNSRFNGRGMVIKSWGIIEGDWVDGFATGSGIKITDDYVYEGEMLRGQPNGKGKMTYITHPIFKEYTGDWVNGYHHGQGTMIWKNGSTFNGQWVYDSFQKN